MKFSLRHPFIALQADTSAFQFIDRFIDVINDKIQQGKRGRLVVVFWICKRCAAARQMQSEPVLATCYICPLNEASENTYPCLWHLASSQDGG